MKIYDVVFFWLGGVLTETVAERTVAELLPAVKGHAAVAIRQQARALADSLALGAINPADYCREAVKLGEGKLSATELERRILDGATLRTPLVDLVAKIPERYECWLVADYPQSWLKELAARWQIPSLFRDERIVVTSALGLVRMTPDIFYRLPQAAGRPMEECIVVDGLSSRTVAAMKHGLAAVFYVYPERLKLELALQHIWQTDADVMHPSSSERVKLA